MGGDLPLPGTEMGWGCLEGTDLQKNMGGRYAVLVMFWGVCLGGPGANTCLARVVLRRIWGVRHAVGELDAECSSCADSC